MSNAFSPFIATPSGDTFRRIGFPAFPARIAVKIRRLQFPLGAPSCLKAAEKSPAPKDRSGGHVTVGRSAR
jgi:hypothetical protein